MGSFGEKFADPKISYGDATILHAEDVIRLDVTVHKSMFVQVVEASKQLASDILHSGQWQGDWPPILANHL